MKGLNLAFRFLLELAALAALGYWGATSNGPDWERAALAVGTPLATALFWGTFVSPRARVPLPAPVRFVLGLAVFACAAAALVERRYIELAEIFAAAVVLNASLLIAWRQDDPVPPDSR